MKSADILVSRRTPAQIREVSSLADRIYPHSTGWPVEKLAAHQSLFPEGQLVAVHAPSGTVIGASLNLIVDWSTLALPYTYRDLVDNGWFGTHSPRHGRFLYAAELMVSPQWRRLGVGKALIEERVKLAAALGLLGTRGSARLMWDPKKEGGNWEAHVGQLSAGRGEPVLDFMRACGAMFLAILLDHFDGTQDDCPHAVLTEFLC